ncbi:MAG: NRDE family protein [Deltaproteobacteria bacterium]|nr:MAG: NRDE family protein [Deltaproteobacteria bacterium]
MCLLLMALNTHATYPLILLANRDEYYERPSASAYFWDEAPSVLAGKDLRAGGTWLGITRKGSIGAVTNYRDPASIRDGAPSRGKLVSDFLLGELGPEEYIEKLDREAEKYNGFNLIVGKKGQYYWYSNRGDGVRSLSAGIYGLGNHLLDTPWPKVVKSKDALVHLLSEQEAPSLEELFLILADHTIAGDEDLPDTGVGLEWERILSPIFIVSPTYGTRSSTVMLIDADNRVTFVEKTFNADLDHPAITRHVFRIESI